MAEEFLKKVEKKGEVCVGKLVINHSDQPDIDIDDTYYLDFPVPAPNKVILYGLTEKERDLILAIHRKIGITIYHDKKSSKNFFTFREDGEPNATVWVEVESRNFEEIKLRHCSNCKNESECGIGMTLVVNGSEKSW